MSDQKQDRKDPKSEADAAAERAKPLAEKIGFRKLDLTVEEVEERISPRETNVFDK